MKTKRELIKEIADHIRRHTNVCRDYMIYPGGNRYYLNDKKISGIKYDNGGQILYKSKSEHDKDSILLFDSIFSSLLSNF